MELIENKVYSSSSSLASDLSNLIKESSNKTTPHFYVTKEGHVARIDSLRKIYFGVASWLYRTENPTSSECVDKALANICMINEKNICLRSIRQIAVQANLIKENVNPLDSRIELKNKNTDRVANFLNKRLQVYQKRPLEMGDIDEKKINNKNLSYKAFITENVFYRYFIKENAYFKYFISAAMSNKTINENIEECKKYSWSQKIKLAVSASTGASFSGLYLPTSLALVSAGASFRVFGRLPVYLTLSAFLGMTVYKMSFDTKTFVGNVVVVPILEEIVFRALLQNGMSLCQKAAIAVVPKKLGNNRVFKYLTSTSARIVSCNTLFALAHLISGGVPSTLRIAMHPVNAILYETTGTLHAPIVSHMVNNALAFAKETVIKNLV